MERESDKPLAMDNPGPQPTFETSYDKIQHLQQQIDVKNKEIKHLRKEDVLHPPFFSCILNVIKTNHLTNFG